MEIIDTFINKNNKDNCFIRILGITQGFQEDILHMDALLGEKMQVGEGIYKRIYALPKISIEETNSYIHYYEHWINNQKKMLWTKELQENERNKELSVLLSKSCHTIIDLYRNENKQINSGIEKNFVVKLLFWFDFILNGWKEEWKESTIVKITAENIVKKQEYFFFYMLTLIGFDILLLQTEKDIGQEEDRLCLSKKHIVGNYGVCELPVFLMETYKNKIDENNKNNKNSQKDKNIKSDISNKKTEEKNVVISAAIFKQRDQYKHKQYNNKDSIKKQEQESVNTGSRNRREKSFEELARLAVSVVLITIHDKKGEIVGSGSGIMIASNGYILTNHHVLAAGSFYTIRIENDDKVYETDEVIKYHSILDLAILRIDRKLNPIPIYSGKEKLVRGQKVVAIGSPLGLFNSVSDGIISGFRMIDDVDMIQFTAPISAGSSGGAILNMYGEVIGISTAGIDYGQNINLAMGYECINTFIKGFL